ncbi:type II and III secretion system protein [Marinomonas sp. S3726]|uniref:type II and III secretion system protein n=1 Tax=Marinomonas sp. S3726 TaxID=579484 RepID=UPI0005FA2B16|nr:type II and III secretion system protein [Marinomonas sp. S3726]KJZ15371.1 type II and III secretion system protein [Marinomonas sp. S3726]
MIFRLWFFIISFCVPAFAMDVQVKDKSIQDFLPWLAAETGNSLMLSPAIKVNLSLSLTGVSWSELIESIATQHKLDLAWSENTAILMPKALISDEPKSEIEGQGKESTPCVTRFWHLEHALAEKVSQHLKRLYPDLVTSFDKRTNSIVSRSCRELHALEETVTWLDSPVRQIEISARIAQVQNATEKQIGVEWQGQMLGDTLSTAEGLVDLATTGATSGLSFAVTKSDDLLALNLSFLESNGLANIVSEPKIVTAEGQMARIESGTEVPYQTKDDDGTRVEFKQAGLTLEVIPFVKKGDKVQLSLKIHQDAVGEMYNGVPSIETNRINTQVVVGNEETLILGGIYRDEVWESMSKVPFLGDLPLVGALFRQQTQRQEKVELLVFITPKLLQMSYY